MKKIFVLFCLAFIVLAGQPGHAQLAVFDAIIDALLADSALVDKLYYAQQLADNALNLGELIAQTEHMGNTVKMQFDNLRRIGDIKSWDDFKEWHNRQIYLEKRTEDMFMGMNISIGNKNYTLLDVASLQSMGRDLDNVRVDFWNNEFTEEQRREMWYGLGLTPSNYAYVQTWKGREEYLLRRFLTASSVQNEEYIKGMNRNNEFLETLAKDKDRDMDDKIGEKELAAMNVEVAIDTNKTLNDIHMVLTEMMELEAVKMYQAQTPIDQPVLSEWPENVFGALTD